VLHELRRSNVEVESYLVIDVAGDRAPRAPGESERPPWSRSAPAGARSNQHSVSFRRQSSHS